MLTIIGLDTLMKKYKAIVAGGVAAINQVKIFQSFNPVNLG